MDENQDALNITTAPWEEDMISELASKLNISEDAVLEVMSTVLVNELSAVRNGKQTMMSMISAELIRQDMKQTED